MRDSSIETERLSDKADLLVIYIDGQRYGAHVISAVGVDRGGVEYISGIEPGATEDAAAVKSLCTDLRDQGLRTPASACSSLTEGVADGNRAGIRR